MSTQKHILRLGTHLYELHEVSQGIFRWISTFGTPEGSVFSNEETAINWARERARNYGEQGSLLVRENTKKETL